MGVGAPQGQAGGEPDPTQSPAAAGSLAALLRVLPPGVIVPPLAVLLAASLAAGYAPGLPASLAGLRLLGPGLVLCLAVAVALWFNRGRASVFAITLLLAWASCELAREAGGLVLAAVYTALVVLVPLNLLAAFALPERGVLSWRNLRWLGLGAGEVLLVGWLAWIARSAQPGGTLASLLEAWPLRSPPTPLAGRMVFTAAFVAALWRAWPRGARTHVRPLDAGLACATAGLFIACEWQFNAGTSALFIAATGLVLLLAVMQESHRLAFRDELTGLPSRRALDERLHALGPRYTVAMIDIDHFKRFNDTHGHDIGDQVLRVVAARLAQVGGGGRAFRYGGEEFCVLFNGLDTAQARPHVEALREAVAGYRMTVRDASRPADREAGALRRASAEASPAGLQQLSVTISAGLAGNRGEDARATPYDTLKLADQALYRAKQAGRNRVSD